MVLETKLIYDMMLYSMNTLRWRRENDEALELLYGDPCVNLKRRYTYWDK